MEIASSPSNPRASEAPNRPSLTGRPSLAPPPPEPGIIARQTERVLGFFSHLGVIWGMLVGSVRAGFRRPFEGRAIVKQLESLGVASVGIVVVTSVFIGMVMAVQFAFGLQKFGGLEYTGRVIALSFARELAPTLTAVIVGGRIGSGMAAELGAMAVTEQIDEMISERRYRSALESFAGMAPELETFFKEVMVMVDDEAVRRNRMSLLRKVGGAVTKVADVTKIVVDRRDYRP